MVLDKLYDCLKYIKESCEEIAHCTDCPMRIDEICYINKVEPHEWELKEINTIKVFNYEEM